MSLLIIDYGMGNLASVRRAFEECGAGQIVLSENPKDMKQASRFVLPGVGAFADGMRHLQQRGWASAIHEAVNEGIPMLGICLGMQLMATKGCEGGEVAGLNLISGEAARLKPASSAEQIPHVGWNEVHETRPSPLWEGVPSGTDFYFVHSYHLVPSETETVIATTPYCKRFVSAVQKGNIFGVQFHPEKSSRPGFQVLRNFLKT